MLEIRPSCENCNKPLPNNCTEAMMCSFECTFCKDCVENVLLNVCPNCGGGFEKRPVRPAALLAKNPESTFHLFKPINKNISQHCRKSTGIFCPISDKRS